jgi:5-methylcytosine-specific restriction protein A
MPRKPKKPCKYQGCPKLTEGLFCDDHKQKESRRYNKYRRDPDSNKRYGTQWRKIRTRYITANPLCEICRESGRLTPADTVHHRIPLADGGTNEWGNLQALCSPCHSRIHMTELNQSRVFENRD